MNPEIYEIINELQSRSKKDSLNEIDKQSYFMTLTSNLSVLLAEEEDLRNKEVSKQTDKIINLTKSIHFLTVVMVIVGIVQLYVAIFK